MSARARRERRKKADSSGAATAVLPEPPAGKWRAPEVLLLLAFVLLCGFDIAHHAMWRDEMQPWLFARDSSSIPNLLANLRYETHPRLWYFILFVVSRFTAHPEAMQVVHLLVISSAMALFIRYCPMPFYLKAATVFSYYFVFEWGAMSRNYSLGILFCFAFCARFPKRDKGYLALAAILFLATQANQFAALLSGALATVLAVEAWLKPALRERVRAHKIEAVSSLLLVYGGVLLAFWIGIAQPDAFQPNYSLSFDPITKISHGLTAVWDGFMPLPELHLLSSWGWGMTGHALLGKDHPAFGFIMAAGSVLFFWRMRPMLWIYLCGAAPLFLIACVKSDDYARHTGHFFVWFLICLWLAWYYPARTKSGKPRPFRPSLVQIAFFCSILSVQLFDTIYVSAAGYYFPFSCGKQVAEYIKDNHLSGLPVFGYPDFECVPVSGYADIRIYYPDTHRWGSFIIENNKRQTNWNLNQVLDAVNEFASQGNRDFLVLLCRPLMTEENGRLYALTRVGNLQQIASFYPCMQGDEIYWLFRYQSPAPPG